MQHGGHMVAGLARKKERRVRSYYSEGGLRKWVSEKWVDIGAPKKNGKYQPCGRSEGSAKGNIQNAYHLQKPHG
jgi:hypothetical protein